MLPECTSFVGFRHINFVNHERIFKYDVFRGCIPVPKMIKYVLRTEKKSILVFV